MLLVEPSSEKSGIQVINADQLNTIYVQNTKLRRAYYVIQRMGHIDASGVFVKDPLSPVVQEGDVPMLPGFESSGAIISSVTEDYYSRNTLDESQSSLAASRTELTPLPIVPEGARRTHYRVVVLTAGNPLLSYDKAVYDSLADQHKKKITGFQPENLLLQALVVDYLIPVFLTALGYAMGKEASNDKESLQVALLGEVLEILLKDLPGIVDKLKGNDSSVPGYSAVDAIQEIRRNHLVNRLDAFPWFELSGFSRDMLKAVLKWIAYEVLNVANGEALLDFLEGRADPRHAAGAAPRPEWLAKVPALERAGTAFVMEILGTIDLALNALNKHRLFYDSLTSAQLEAFEVKVLSAKVRLRPTPIEVEVIGSPFTVTADVIDSVNEEGKEKAPITFDWECSAKYGDLFPVGGGADRINRFTSSRDHPSAQYVSRGTANGDETDETIKITAYFGGLNDPAREEIGSFTEPVRLLKGDTYILEAFGADDMATVWLNGRVLYEDPPGSYAGIRGPLVFKGKPDDRLRIRLADWWGAYAGGGPLKLRLPDGTLQTLMPGVNYKTPIGNKSVVFDQTYTL